MFSAMFAILDSEWGIIFALIAVVILFGSAKLPKFARSLGSAQSEFKKGLAEGAKDDSTTANTSNTEQSTPSSLEQTSMTSSLEQKITDLEKKISSMETKSSDQQSAQSKTE